MKDLLAFGSIDDNESQLERQIIAVNQSHVLLQSRLTLLVFNLDEQDCLVEFDHFKLVSKHFFGFILGLSEWAVQEVSSIHCFQQVNTASGCLELDYKAAVGHHDFV